MAAIVIQMKIDVITLLLTQRTLNRFTAIIQCSDAKYKIASIPLIVWNFSIEGAIGIN